MAMWYIYIYIIYIILSFGINICNKKKEKSILNQIFDEYSKSKSLASLNQSLGLMYDDLAYDEDPTFIA